MVKRFLGKVSRLVPRACGRASRRCGRGARLGPLWQTESLFNPVVCLINGLRWAFFGAVDVPIAVRTGRTLTFLVASLAVVRWMFKTGWRIRRRACRFEPALVLVRATLAFLVGVDETPERLVLVASFGQ